MSVRHTEESDSGYWPTPNAVVVECSPEHWLERRERFKRGESKFNPGLKLETAVHMWPTPTQSDHKGSGPTMVRKDGKLRGDRLDYATERNPDGRPTGGQLNPSPFVEWLMGWPIGWTCLKPLETARYLEFLQQHGEF